MNFWGKTATVTFQDINTLTVVTPAVAAGSQRVTITNPDGETISWDAAFLANWFCISVLRPRVYFSNQTCRFFI